MATGVPKVGHTGAHVAITYPGKRPIAEILADEAASVRPVFATTCAANRVYLGENARILRLLLRDSSLRGAVRLVYVDPPFASQAVYHSRQLTRAYDDTMAGAAYLEFLRERVILLRELLADDGSLYLHLDDKMVFQAKLILDEVFGAANFRNCIARKKCNPKNYTHRAYGNVTDYILFYAKSAQCVWNRPHEPWNDARAKEYRYTDPTSGRRYMKVPVHAPGVRHGETGTTWRGKAPPPGKHWQYPPRVLEEMDGRGEIYWSPTGNPRRKVYLDTSAGVPVQDMWLDYRDAHNQNIKITGYPTEKNPDMLRRIVEASSNPGDLVLDAFAGSGTTLAAAAELERRFIGIDDSAEAIRAILKRFTRGTERMGDFIKREPKRPRQQGALFAVDAKAKTEQPRLVKDFAVLAEAGRERDVAADVEQIVTAS